MKTAILAIFMFVVMILPHEFGHFLAAKSVGVQVNEFAFGMGPAIWKRKRGETLYSLRVFPIGGYCAMEGEDEDETGGDNPRAFVNKSPLQKIYVLAAGAAMNVLICILILLILAFTYGMTTNVVDSVVAGSPAEAAGLKAGDVITQVGDTETKDWNAVRAAFSQGGDPLAVTYERDGQAQTTEVTPAKTAEGAYQVGITSRITRSPGRALSYSLKTTKDLAFSVWDGLRMLVTGGADISDVSGPVGIVSYVHDTMQYGLWYFFMLLALVSVNLAVINLLPLPALDGGRILFVIIRGITGRKITDRMEGTVHLIGMALLLALAVFVTFSDIMKLR